MLYNSYTRDIADRVWQVDNKHNTIRKTHTFRLHNRNNHIQNKARFNTVPTHLWTPIKDWWTSWDLYNGTIAVRRQNQRILFVESWRELDWFKNILHLTSKLPILHTLRYVKSWRIRQGKIGLLSHELRLLEDLSYDELHWSPVTWSCSQ